MDYLKQAIEYEFTYLVYMNNQDGIILYPIEYFSDTRMITQHILTLVQR